MAYGTISADVIQSSVTGVSLGAGNATVFKNRIINGDMRIDQRNAGASVTPPSGGANYTLDRWRFSTSQASKFTTQQNAGAVTPPTGFINYLGVTSSSAYSVLAGDNFDLRQIIEGLNVADLAWGTANAKTVTVSFQVYSSLTGTFGGALKNSAANRSYPFSYSIASANTWTQISVTIAGDTSGTWLTTNGTGITVQFGLGVGSTYSGTAGTWASSNYLSATGATSVVGTSGATFYITGVQLEVGSSATGFEYVDYTNQLAMCQRYYAKLNNDGSGGDITLGFGIQTATTTAIIYIKYPVTMRTEPTATISNLVTSDFVNFSADATLGAIQPAYDSGSLNVSYASNGAQLRPIGLAIKNNTSGFIALSAEL
jgi:hypothetical protein